MIHKFPPVAAGLKGATGWQPSDRIGVIPIKTWVRHHGVGVSLLTSILSSGELCLQSRKLYLA